LRDTGFQVAIGLVVPLYVGDQIVNLFSFAHKSKIHQESYINDMGSIVLGDGNKAIIATSPLELLVYANFELEGFRLIYSHDNNYSDLLDGVTTAYVKEPIADLALPQYRITIPKGDCLFKYSRNALVSKESILEMLDNATVSGSPVPKPQNNQTLYTEKDGHYFISNPRINFRVTGLERNKGYHSFKITLKAWIPDSDYFYLDSIDLCSDKNRLRFVDRASQELSISSEDLKLDMGKLLLIVEQIQEKRLNTEPEETNVEISPNDRKEAIEFLSAPNLFQRIQSDFDTCGMVGEEFNRLIGYVACTSRLLDKPLGNLVQSSSSAGKSTIQKAVLRFMPPEDVLQFSSITAQSLYYLGSQNISNKILAIAEEEGSSRASYALKLLLSEGELTIASTGKDQDTGVTTTQTFKVEGRVSLNMTTTSLSIDPELENRLITVSANESKEQTKAIHAAQKLSRTLVGLRQREEAKTIANRHRNAQRLLVSYPVINPHIDKLEFDTRNTRSRRDFEKLLTLIDAVTLLHQYQRELVIREVGDKEIQVLLVTEEDITIARSLAGQVLQNSVDELPAQTRKVWDSICQFIKKQNLAWNEVRFTRRQIRELCGTSLTMMKIHMDRLVECEFIKQASGKFGSKFTYEALIEPTYQ